MSRTVVVTDHVFPSMEHAAAELAPVDADLLAPNDREALLGALPGADAVLTTYFPLDAALIGLMRRCRIIARFGVGVDNVDVAAAERQGIWVTNVPDYCIEEVSDHTLALILALVRRVPFLNARTHAGDWTFQPARPIHRLGGLVLGLIGFGKIGRRVCQKARIFGFRVLAYDPYLPASEVEGDGASPVDLDTLLSSSDVVSVHAPLVSGTSGLLGREALARMKEGAFVVNTSRGGIVDEAALREALDEGRLAGAALDVLEREGPGWESPLRGHPHVVLTPHVAFYSEDSVAELQRKAARQVAKVLAGSVPDYPVNRPPRAR